MKSLLCPMCLVVALAALTSLGRAASASAAEDQGALADRIQRIERRLDEMAERQEQMMRRFEAQMEPRGATPLPPPEEVRNPMPPGGHHPVQVAAKAAKDISGLLGLMFLAALLCNILLTIWIFTDIRKRGEGSGIFVAMALIAGIPAALIYALARIGDRKI